MTLSRLAPPTPHGRPLIVIDARRLPEPKDYTMNCPWCWQEAEYVDTFDGERCFVCNNPDCDMPADNEHVFLESDVTVRIMCPCCDSIETELVDKALVVDTGEWVATGHTRQCDRCFVFFQPEDVCDESEELNV